MSAQSRNRARRLAVLTVAAFACAACGGVLSQTPPANPPSSVQNDAAPPAKPRDLVPQARPPAPSTLSEQLSRSGGVIQPPPQVDRKIEAPTPDPGAQSMPVIPPPGTPGGDPTVKPK
jgi:hypothetical protein